MNLLNEPVPSLTALLSAAARGAHLLVDGPNALLDDVDARALCALFEPSPLAFHLGHPDAPVLAAARASAVIRSRFATDVIAAHEVEQIVLLGAGLDSSIQADGVAQRWLVDRPDVLGWRSNLFDQAGIENLGQPVPLDLARANLASVLTEAGLDPDRRTAVVALGLTMYLDAGAVQTLFGQFDGLAAGSVLVADALLPDEAADEAGRAYAAAITAQAGGREPWRWRPISSELDGVLAEGGWRAEIVPEAEAVPSWFWEQQRHLHPQGLVQLVRASRR